MKKILVVLTILSFVLCDIYAFVFPTAKVVLNENIVTLGDTVKVKFEIEVPYFVKFIQDEERIDIEGWEIKNVSFKKDYRTKGKYIVETDIVTYDSSIKQIPSVKFFYINKDFDYYEEFSFSSSPIDINIDNTFANDDFNSIRDIKNPKKLTISKFVYLFICLFVLFVVFVIYGRLFFNKFNKRIIVDSFNSKEIAIREINKLLQNEDFSSKNIKNYYFILSDIFKKFILSMQNINNIEMTTEEVVCLLKREESCFLKYVDEIEKLLKDYDYVKYSGKNINSKEFIDIFAHTKNIIERY